MPAQPGLLVLVALVILVVLAVSASLMGRLGTHRRIALAAVRAVIQLAVVASVIALVLRSIWWSLLFAVLMFSIATATTAARVGARRAWPWAGAAVAAGVVPVLVVIFGVRAVPFTGPALIAFAGIIIGGAMNAHSLAGLRVFGALREQHASYEAALALGMVRPEAIDVVALRVLPEALVPGLDQTRTVGLVTLPGAFIGVLLGGGSPVQAGAAQVLVLIAIMAGQACTVTVLAELVRRGLVLPGDLRGQLRP